MALSTHQMNASRIKPLAWEGISGSVVRIVFGIIALVSPPQIGNKVVNTGIFRFTRNPIYLAFILLLLGWALFLASPWALLGPLAYALYIARFQIIPEERALAAKFGTEYQQYRTRVRR
jgi:protein-S-isoprenylcysteine O-methyltransferase Ste14